MRLLVKRQSDVFKRSYHLMFYCIRIRVGCQLSEGITMRNERLCVGERVAQARELSIV